MGPGRTMPLKLASSITPVLASSLACRISVNCLCEPRKKFDNEAGNLLTKDFRNSGKFPRALGN